jgi:hypothetical protein
VAGRRDSRLLAAGRTESATLELRIGSDSLRFTARGGAKIGVAAIQGGLATYSLSPLWVTDRLAPDSDVGGVLLDVRKRYVAARRDLADGFRL